MPLPAEETASNIRDGLMFDLIRRGYRNHGVSLTDDLYEVLNGEVCDDMRQGGRGYFTIGDVSHLSESEKDTLAQAVWLVDAIDCFPAGYAHSASDLHEISDFYTDLLPEFDRRLQAAGLRFPSSDFDSLASALNYGSSFRASDYSNDYSYGSLPRNSSSNSGYATFCTDGTVSQSGGKREACSWHGGVSE